MQPPRLGRVETIALGHAEKVDVLERRRAGRVDITQPRVHDVAEMDAVVALQYLEAIEEAATDIAGTLVRIGSIGRYQDRLLPGLEALLQRREAGVAE